MQDSTSTALVVAEPTGPNVAALVAGYLAGYQPATRRSYTTDLRDWFNWCAQQGIPPLTAQRAHMDFYLRQLEEAGRAAATVNRRITSVGGFYRYLNEEGIIDQNPIRRVKRRHVNEDSGKPMLDRDELLALLADSKRKGPVQHALLSLLILNALRVGETCDALVEQLREEKGTTLLFIPNGKGGKAATVPLVGQCLKAVQAAVDGRTRGPILLGTFGRPLTRHQAWRIVMTCGVDAGVGKHIHPHLLRHAAITAALEAGAALHDVQDMARPDALLLAEHRTAGVRRGHGCSPCTASSRRSSASTVATASRSGGDTRAAATNNDNACSTAVSAILRTPSTGFRG